LGGAGQGGAGQGRAGRRERVSVASLQCRTSMACARGPPHATPLRAGAARAPRRAGAPRGAARPGASAPPGVARGSPSTPMSAGTEGPCTSASISPTLRRSRVASATARLAACRGGGGRRRGARGGGGEGVSREAPSPGSVMGARRGSGCGAWSTRMLGGEAHSTARTAHCHAPGQLSCWLPGPHAVGPLRGPDAGG
jgi:hypothetical protein